MDFLDPKKERAHNIRIILGYILIGIALILTTIILLYQAYGFGVDRKGNVIQNGLVFVSSTPNPAEVYVNGQKRDNTNTRLLLSSGQYTFELKRDGYRNWKRAVTVEGGSVDRFDYPFLFPASLQASNVKKYDKQPALVTQSPDRKWLLVQGANTAQFDMYDLSDQQQVAQSVRSISLPPETYTAADANASQGWELVQWSTNNRHVVLRHNFTKDNIATYEYVLLDREVPSESVNLTKKWGMNPTYVELQDQKFDKYYMLDQATKIVSTATLDAPTPKAYQQNVLAFKTYGNDVILYATQDGAPEGKVAFKLREGKGDPQTVRTVPHANKYLVNLTKYEGDWYVAMGSDVEGKVYVYKNPAERLKEDEVIAPVRVLKAAGANYIAFSPNARFIMAENGVYFSVYDAENNKGFTYAAKNALDTPQTHATWMDGHRLIYTSGSKLHVFDFDGSNQQTLNATNAAFLPFFDRDYENVYSLSPATAEGSATLQKTPLRTAQDQ